jgi:hypothetical protein
LHNRLPVQLCGLGAAQQNCLQHCLELLKAPLRLVSNIIFDQLLKVLVVVERLVAQEPVTNTNLHISSSWTLIQGRCVVAKNNCLEEATARDDK